MPEKEHSKIEQGPLSQEDVVRSLKEDPNNLSMFHAYLERRENEVHTSREALLLVVETADIYFAAELFGAAKAALEDALEAADNEGDAELVVTLYDKLASISLS